MTNTTWRRARRALVACAAATVLLSGCGGGEEVEPVASPAVTTPAVDEPAPAPSPDSAQAAELLTALAAIDPSLGEEKSIDRARDMCGSILSDRAGQPHPQYTLSDLVRMRFTAEHLTDEQATRVVAAIDAGGWCV